MFNIRSFCSCSNSLGARASRPLSVIDFCDGNRPSSCRADYTMARTPPSVRLEEFNMRELRERHDSGKKRPCKLCIEKVTEIDYKDPFKLRRFLSEQGKILSRRISGNCAEHQREITLAVKRCREIGLVAVD